MISYRTMVPGLALVLCALTSVAHGDVGKGVQKALRGKILITDTPLPAAGEDDKKTIKQYKAAHKKELAHDVVDEIPTWRFHYTAFLKKAPKTTALAFDFYNSKRQFVADKRFTGIDPKLKILSGFLAMNEDDNLNKGQTYVVKLTGKVRGREVVFATTKLTLK